MDRTVGIWEAYFDDDDEEEAGCSGGMSYHAPLTDARWVCVGGASDGFFLGT